MPNSIYGKGRQVIDNNLKIVDEADQTKKLQWEVSGIASGTTVVMTAPTSDFNFNIPVFGVTTVDKITIDNIVIDANDISSSSGNLTITPVAGSAVVIDGGASFDGTVLTGLTALTSTAITGTLQTATQGNIDHDSLANFLSTEHFLQSAITTVGALTNITAGGDFTLTQNSVVPFTSVESGAIANTLYLKAGSVFIGKVSGSEKFGVESSSTSDEVTVCKFNSSGLNGVRVLRLNCGSDVDRDGLLMYAGSAASRIWIDDANKLRIHNGAPTANDSGTVVGDQTSLRASKQDIVTFTDCAGALQKIINTNIYNFRYKDEVKGYGDAKAKVRTGFMIDESPSEFRFGNSMDMLTTIGYLICSFKQVEKRLKTLEAA